MTKELKQKAKKWVKDNTKIEYLASFGDMEVEPSAEKGYIAGAESRQPEIDKACELLKKLKYRIPHLPEWDADYEDEERLRSEVEQFLKEQGR